MKYECKPSHLIPVIICKKGTKGCVIRHRLENLKDSGRAVNWAVLRDGGNSNHKRRIIFSGDECQCELKYNLAVEKMRQGAVHLVNPDGKIIKTKIAYRLRTRW